MTATTATLEKMQSRIAALIAKAEDEGATEAEAFVFMAKAEELMVRYAIDRSQLEGKGKLTKEPITSQTFPFPEAKCFWVALGLNGAFAVVSAVGLADMAYTNRFQKIVLYGTATDIEHTWAMLQSVWMQARVGLKLYRSTDVELIGIKERLGTNNSFYWNAQYQYLEGFCYGFASKIREAKEAVIQETGSELVWVGRAQEIGDFMKNDGVKPGRSHTTGMTLTDARNKGRRDGREASIGNEVGR